MVATLSADVIKQIKDGGYAPGVNAAFRIIPVPPSIPPEQQLILHRINSLGSSYFFIKVALNRNKLTSKFHLPLCRQMERTHLKDLWEIPRDHLKSTICSEGLPMWWALPLSVSDMEAFLDLGYSNEFIAFMIQMHNPCTRTLLISETITNAAMLGSKIRKHFESNAIYRTLFPETLPTAAETWTNFSLHVKRPAGADPHGEGTFDLLGVGSALQSRHYHRHVKDDLVGRKAIESQSIMDKSIEYHRLTVGAYELQDPNYVNDELVIGNRWSYHDLNSYIRENETWFNIHSHSALGGCCDEHPVGIPIFPEEFSVAKLERIKAKLGSYAFSCQFENNPCSPEDADFRPEWLRYYDLKMMPDGNYRIEHEVYDGIVRKDLDIHQIYKVEITDPAHAGNASANRCRHAVIVVGLCDTSEVMPNGKRVNFSNMYLLDCFAKSGSYDMYFNAIYDLADKWNIRKLGVETVAAQKYIAYHINYRNLQSGRRLKIVELKGEAEAADGTVTRRKEFRIRNVLLPIFEEGRFWCQRRHADFIGEYTSFPKGKFCDILDALAYAPQVLKTSTHSEDWSRWVEENHARVQQLGKPYSIGVN